MFKKTDKILELLDELPTWIDFVSSLHGKQATKPIMEGQSGEEQPGVVEPSCHCIDYQLGHTSDCPWKKWKAEQETT